MWGQKLFLGNGKKNNEMSICVKHKFIMIFSVSAENVELPFIFFLQILQTGQCDSVLMKCPDELGLLKMVRLYHDNSGEGAKAGWLLEKIIITNQQNHKQSVVNHICLKIQSSKKAVT